MAVTEPAANRGAATRERIVRHALVDRIFHWLTAAAVLVLLGTAFLPIVGVEFGWVTIHWLTGVVLLLAVAFHLVRSLLWQDWRAMWIGMADLRDGAAILRATVSRGAAPAPKPGKYSLAQKLVHAAFALAVLATAVTGALMLARIDSPWWQRNPYVLSQDVWGVVYVLHGLAALTLITLVMAHIYFALRPEKLFFTRSMLLGWITRREYAEHHDPQRWQVRE